MMKLFFKTITVLSILLFLSSCHKGIEQNSMFNGRSHKTKKKGIYDAGMGKKKPISVQIAKEYDKLSKYDSNPRKAAKKANKALEKKKKATAKRTAKFLKKKKLKAKKSKDGVSGDK